MHRILPRAGSCEAPYQWYVCNLNGFKGCCSDTTVCDSKDSTCPVESMPSDERPSQLTDTPSTETIDYGIGEGMLNRPTKNEISTPTDLSILCLAADQSKRIQIQRHQYRPLLRLLRMCPAPPPQQMRVIPLPLQLEVWGLLLRRRARRILPKLLQRSMKVFGDRQRPQLSRAQLEVLWE